MSGIRCAVLVAVILAGFAVRAFEVRQVLRDGVYSRGNVNLRPQQPIDWASWLWIPGADATDRRRCVRFRREFKAHGGLRFDVSADTRFILTLDGREIARGPHNGSPQHWYYETYDVFGLGTGGHVMEATVFDLGEAGPCSILTSGSGGFVLKAEGVYDDELTTGKAPWQVAEVKCLSFGGRTDPRTLAGSENVLWGSGIVECEVSGWCEPVVVKKPVKGVEYGVSDPLWPLFPTERPDPIREVRTPGRMRAAQDVFAEKDRPYSAADAGNAWVRRFDALLKSGTRVEIPARTQLRVLWDYDDYYCGYPVMETSGGNGAEIRWAWAESLCDSSGERGNRDEFIGKAMRYAMHDTFLPDGRTAARFSTPWWKSGRWAEVSVRTADEPLVVTGLSLVETRYPLETEAQFSCDDPSLDGVWRICLRGLQNCLHEMFMDCPYFEQQMYPGDTRVEMLVFDSLCPQDHMLRFGIGTFDYARRENGFVPMNYPTRPIQDSSTYSMAWVAMLGDYVRWHGTNEFLRARLPGMRHTLDALAYYENADGLLDGLPGWSFMDWAEGWDDHGNAPDGRSGVSAVNNLFYLYALKSAARVEAATGNGDLADHWNRKAECLGAAILGRFWCERRQLVADTVALDCFSEHAQCLALLTDVLSPGRRDSVLEGLLSASDLTRSTVYFSHYLFDAYVRFGRSDRFLKRLDLWRDFVKQGLRTPLEAPGARGRSDCHAWGAHPLYHLLTGVAGVKPAADGYAAVTVAPRPGGLKWLKAVCPTPRGNVKVDLQFEGKDVTGTVDLPENLPGTFEWQGRVMGLSSGENRVEALKGGESVKNDGVFDVVVYGATPAGISTAIAAGRMGCGKVVVLEPTQRIGGLTTGGLGQTDIGYKEAFGGIARQFYRDIRSYYADERHWKWQSRDEYRSGGQSKTDVGEDAMWTFEPSAALSVLEGWERQYGLDIRRGEWLDRGEGGVSVDNGRISAIRTLSGKTFRGRMFVDATYEGDLMAVAGVSYAVGREANSVYGETINGVQVEWHPDSFPKEWDNQIHVDIDPYRVPGERSSGLIRGIEPEGRESPNGSGDHRVQAYCFRACFTDVPENRIPFIRPESYDERDYEILFRMAEAGEDLTVVNFAKMPNRKTDSNNRGGFSMDYIGGNWNYPEASYEERERIVREHLHYQQGLMWTLANHPRIPAEARKFFSSWGTCRDEFVGERGSGWQNQLYVREARRMIGEYVMTERDCRQERRVPRPVALAAYGMDSHNVRRHVRNGFVRNEGDVQDHLFKRPYPIEYGSLVPRRCECGNLLVPVCLSASHIAFGSIRMEPVFFALGQVAGTAAALAIESDRPVQDVDYAVLRERLLHDGQILETTTCPAVVNRKPNR